MTLSVALQGVKRVLFDASVIIDFGEERERSMRVVTAFLRRIESNEIEAVGSVLLLPEVLTYTRVNAIEETVYSDFLAKMQLLPVSEEIAERATDYRVMYNLRTADAVHLATAIIAEAGALVTSDSDFLRAQGVPVGNPGAGRTLRIVHTERVVG